MPVKRLKKAEINALKRAAEIANDVADCFNDPPQAEIAVGIGLLLAKYADEPKAEPAATAK